MSDDSREHSGRRGKEKRGCLKTAGERERENDGQRHKEGSGSAINDDRKGRLER